MIRTPNLNNLIYISNDISYNIVGVGIMKLQVINAYKNIGYYYKDSTLGIF